MKTRVLRVSLALGLTLSLQAPVLAQVRPVLMPSLSAIPGAAAGASFSAASIMAASPVPTLAPALSPMLAAPSLNVPTIASSLAPTPAAALAATPAVAAAPALSLAPKAAPASAAPRAAAASLSGLNAAPVPAGAPALAGYNEGRLTFDGGAALEGPASADAPAPAARGDNVKFNGVTLPTRMFSDQTQISTHLIRAIDATKKTLDIAIYELAIREVRDALVRAKGRGVKVRIVMDQGHLYPEKSTGHRTPEVQSLIDAGFDLKTLRGGDSFGIMHNKFAVFDGALLETGSYNWTRAADTQHFENALFDNDGTRIASYQGYWDWMWTNARVVDDKNPPAKPVLDEHGHSPAPMPPAPQDDARTLNFNGVALPRESYTPHGTSALLVSAMDAAKESLVVANFSFTHADLIEALKRAKDRGLEIRIVFDRTQYGFLKEMAEMADLGFDVRLSNGKDGQKGVMHNKFVVIDGKLVETGSFNWTFNGELNNYENAAFLDAPDDAAAWAAYFERIWKQGNVPTPADHQDHPRHDAGDGLVSPEFTPQGFVQPRAFIQQNVGPRASFRAPARSGRQLSRKEIRNQKKQQRRAKKQNRGRKNRFGY